MARSRSDRRNAQLGETKPGDIVLGQKSSRTGSFRQTPIWVPGDPEAVRPVVPGETYPLFVAGIVLAFVALFVCFNHGYLLLYGDAVAHLAIARRILDAKWPGLAQLGGVWLPLPHLLMLPFISNMRMWQTGLAGAPMSMLSYAASVAGIWRLARRMHAPPLGPRRHHLLRPQRQPPLPLHHRDDRGALPRALRLVHRRHRRIHRRPPRQRHHHRPRPHDPRRPPHLRPGLHPLRRLDHRRHPLALLRLCHLHAPTADIRRRMRPHFIVFTIIVAAGPLLWFWYNAHFEHDWLDFLRGPYSAAQIERRTAPPGQHYRGWHNPGWAALFYTRTAQIDAAAWETGFALMARRALRPLALPQTPRRQPPSAHRAESFTLLLWIPLPFYIYSVAYGSVPIFIPQLWPHAFYNARYGMELLPALAIYAALSAEQFETFLKSRTSNFANSPPASGSPPP